MRDKAFLILAHQKKIVAFRDTLHRPAAIRAFAFHDLLLGPESLIRRAVPAFIGPLLQFALVEELLEQFLHHGDMFLVGRADEGIVRDIKLFPELLEVHGHAVRVRLWGKPALLRGLCHLLAVLVRAREEEHGIPPEPMVARKHVRRDRCVSVPDMRHIIHVIDGSSDVEFTGHMFVIRNSLMMVS